MSARAMVIPNLKLRVVRTPTQVKLIKFLSPRRRRNTYVLDDSNLNNMTDGIYGDTWGRHQQKKCSFRVIIYLVDCVFTLGKTSRLGPVE